MVLQHAITIIGIVYMAEIWFYPDNKHRYHSQQKARVYLNRLCGFQSINETADLATTSCQPSVNARNFIKTFCKACVVNFQ